MKDELKGRDATSEAEAEMDNINVALKEIGYKCVD
jgi:hypothetical protein